MNDNNLNQDTNLDSLNMNNQAPLELPKENTPIVEDTTNLTYSEVLRPGEELDDYHHEQHTEVIDTKFLKNNTLAILAIATSLIIPVVPIVLAIIAIIQIRKTHEGARPLAIAAIFINLIVIAVETVLFMFIQGIGPFEDKMKNVTEDQMRICNYFAYGCDNDEDEDGFKTCSYCKDDECIDIVTIECPTDALLEKSKLDNEKRENLTINK